MKKWLKRIRGAVGIVIGFLVVLYFLSCLFPVALASPRASTP